jgi:hypothetical protein
MASTKPPPEPTVPRTRSQEFGDDTGQHVRVTLDGLSQQVAATNTKLDEAIKVDKDDHADMRADNKRVWSEVQGTRTEVRLMNTTLNVVADSMGLKNRVDAAREQARIDDEGDRKKRRRALLYSWLERAGVAVIAGIAALLAAGHRC